MDTALRPVAESTPLETLSTGATLRLCIVGGGFTGVLLAIQAIRVTTRPLAITIVEPAAELGRGIAYGTRDPVHRINVPSQRMAVLAADELQPTRWLFAGGVLPDAGSDADGRFYVPRQAFGAFIGEFLAATRGAAKGRVVLRHVRAWARGVEQHAGGWRVALDEGRAQEADVVAFCPGHALPALPCPVEPAAVAHPKFIADPWSATRFDALAPDDTLLIAGTGLTMADVVASLTARGHRGALTAASRRALLPHAQGAFLNTLDVRDGAPLPQTALGLLRLVRAAVRRHHESGWQPVVDSVRAQLAELWMPLSAHEKRRVVKRLLPFWEVHRFRIAPQIGATLARKRQDGSLVIRQGALRHVGLREDRFAVTLQPARGDLDVIVCDGVVLCTGPDKDPCTNPFLASLVAAGYGCLDEAGIGIAVDRHSRVIDAAGTAQPGLLAFGPLTRGTFGEMTGAPDIARHIETVAGILFR